MLSVWTTLAIYDRTNVARKWWYGDALAFTKPSTFTKIVINNLGARIFGVNMLFPRANNVFCAREVEICLRNL